MFKCRTAELTRVATIENKTWVNFSSANRQNYEWCGISNGRIIKIC